MNKNTYHRDTEITEKKVKYESIIWLAVVKILDVLNINTLHIKQKIMYSLFLCGEKQNNMYSLCSLCLCGETKE